MHAQVYKHGYHRQVDAR